MDKYVTERKVLDLSEATNADFSNNSHIEINLADLPSHPRIYED